MDKTIMPNRVQSQSMAAYWDKWKKSIVVLLSTCIASCSSIGPIMVPRDRVEYTDAIGHSWEQQTLLNIVKLRYGHAPVFLSITQIVTGYQFQGTASAELIASTFNPATNAFGFSGTTSAEGQYTDRPSIIYAPLTGVDFLQKLMTPIPPSTILFLLQAGYDAELVMPLTLDSINGLSNADKRAMTLADPEFTRLVHLMRDLQLAEALQVQIERPKEGNETSLMIFPPRKNPQAMAESRAARRILGLSPSLQRFKAYYGGNSGKDDEIAMMTRSMMQVMLELAVSVQVPQTDVVQDRVAPGQVELQAGQARPALSVNILCGNEAPSNAAVAVQYNHQWFWIADTDFPSKAVFSTVMLLFSISDVGIKGSGPIVTIPTNG